MIKKDNKTISSVYSGEKVIEKIYKGTLQVYEGWKKLIASGVPPLTLTKCKGVDLIDYKIYGNSVQNGIPTPEVPIEVESVGEKTKNLFDEQWETGFINNNTGNNSSSSSSIRSVNYIELKPNTNYYVTIPKSNIYPITYKKDKSFSKYIGMKSASFTFKTTEDEYYLRLALYNRTEIPLNVQVEEGTISTEYEPYGYKIPVKSRGKNLIDFFNINSQKYFEPLGKNVYLFEDLEDGESYTLSYTFKSDDIYAMTYLYFYAYDETGNREPTVYLITDSVKKTEHTFIAKKGYTYVLSRGASYEISEVSISKVATFQLEKDEKTDYEPYIEHVTTNIYLKEPLRKVGDYADYIDFESKKVVRKIYNEFVTNISGKSSLTGKYALFLAVMTEKPYFTSSAIGYALSNKFVLNKHGYYHMVNVGGYIQPYITSGGLNRFALTFNDTSITTVEQAQEKIGDGFDVSYVLATPIEETIELPYIPTIKGTTVIEVDTEVQPSNMEVTYKGKGE